MNCAHRLGNLPCDNDEPHKGGGKGCTHTATGGDLRGQEKADGARDE